MSIRKSDQLEREEKAWNHGVAASQIQLLILLTDSTIRHECSCADRPYEGQGPGGRGTHASVANSARHTQRRTVFQVWAGLGIQSLLVAGLQSFLGLVIIRISRRPTARHQKRTRGQKRQIRGCYSKAAFQSAGLPGCVVCHSNHGITHATDARLGAPQRCDFKFGVCVAPSTSCLRSKSA